MSLTKDQLKYIEKLETLEASSDLVSEMTVVPRPPIRAKTERITLRIDSDLMELIDNACDNLGGMSRSDVIRWALTEWVERNPDKVRDPDENPNNEVRGAS